MLSLFCGTTRIRTGDTRIFSPMLYQLSYGTIVLLFSECKGRAFFLTDQTFPHFFRSRCEKSPFSYINLSNGKSLLVR